MIYSNKFINFISLGLSLIIFSIFFFHFFNKNVSLVEVSSFIPKIDIVKNDDKNEEILQKEKIDLGNWYIEIPAISLCAPISEGTDSNTLNTKVGHFVDTAVETGNIGLAGHNRGYENNYFQNLKKLKKEDQIIYTHDNFKKIYVVNKIEIIDNSNWNYLKESDENKITLITCVEKQPQYRRCVQAVELEN